MRLFGHLLTLACLVMLMAVPSAALGQAASSRGRLTVTVADPSGASFLASDGGGDWGGSLDEGPDDSLSQDHPRQRRRDLCGSGARAATASAQNSRDSSWDCCATSASTAATTSTSSCSRSRTCRNRSRSAARTRRADRASNAFGLTVTEEQIQALSDDPAEMAAAVERHRRPRRDHPGRQLRRPAAAAQVADQVDPCHARSVRRRDRAAGIDVRRRHHPAGHRPDSRRREPLVPRRLDERARASSRRPRDRSRSRGYGFNIGGAVIKQKSNFSLAGQRAEQLHHAESERRAARRARASTCCGCASRSTTSTSTACSTTR